MGTLSPISKRHAFTVIELLVMLCILAIFFVMLWPALHNPPDKVPYGSCMYNQRQIAIELIVFSGDHGERFPWQISQTNGGSLESISSGHVFPHVRILPELYAGIASHFVCPADKEKTRTTNLLHIADENISYFINFDTTTNEPLHSILLGDRNLQADGRWVKPGLFELSTNRDMSWANKLHRHGGVLAFVDGHTEFVQSNRLNSVVQNSSVATNRLCVP